MATKQNVRIKLISLRPLYDEIPQLENQRDKLREGGVADREYHKVLQDDQRAFDAAEAELRRLEQDIAIAKAKRERPSPPEINVDPLPILFPGDLGSHPSEERTERELELSPVITIPRRSVKRDELKDLICRFARYRLSQVDNFSLPIFNGLIADENAHLGKALAVLPWEAVYVQPLTSPVTLRRETPGEHIARLDAWAAELSDYRQQLLKEIVKVRSQVRNVQDILEAWQQRNSDPRPWDALIAAARNALQQKLANTRQEIERQKKCLAEEQAKAPNKE